MFFVRRLFFFIFIAYSFCSDSVANTCDLKFSGEIRDVLFEISADLKILTARVDGATILFKKSYAKKSGDYFYITNNKYFSCNTIKVSLPTLCKNMTGYEPWTYILDSGYTSIRSKLFTLDLSGTAQIQRSKFCGVGSLKSNGFVGVLDTSILSTGELEISVGNNDFISTHSKISGSPKISGYVFLERSKILNSTTLSNRHIIKYTEIEGGSYTGLGLMDGYGSLIKVGPTNNFQGQYNIHSSVNPVTIENAPPQYVYIHPNTKNISNVTIKGLVAISGSDLNISGGTIEGYDLSIREGTTISGPFTKVKGTGLITKSSITNGSNINFFPNCYLGASRMTHTTISGASIIGCFYVSVQDPMFNYNISSNLEGRTFCGDGECFTVPESRE